MEKQVICISWGTRYGAPYINRLYGMVARNITPPFTFTCFTDNRDGIRPEVLCEDLPQVDIDMPKSKGKWPKSRLWSETLADLSGPVLFMDLDVVIVDNIDGFFEFGDPDDVILSRNVSKPFERLGQTSLFRFPVGKLAPLLETFSADPQGIADQYDFEQRFVTRNAPGGIKLWPGRWVRHFRVECIPFFPMNYFMAPRIPKGARVVIFPATPNPPDAIAGRFHPKFDLVSRGEHIRRAFFGPRNHKGVMRNLRRFLLPAAWVKDYWRE